MVFLAIPSHTSFRLPSTVGGTSLQQARILNRSIHQQVGIRDKASLIAYLDSAGIDRDALAELENAITQDGDRREKRFGEHVKSWIGKMIVKAVDGTWKIALNTAPRLLQEALSRYYGWN